MADIKQKANLGQFVVEEQNNQITFTDLRFYRTREGEYFPSVTTILDAYPKTAAFYEWLKKNGDESDNIRDAAGAKGSKIHNLIERYNNGEPVSLIDSDGVIRYSSEEWGALEKWVEFCERFNPEILRSEFNIVSPNLKCAGTIDTVLRLNGKKLIVDFKSSNSVHPHYFLQLAAYKELYQEAFPDEEPIEGVAILHLAAKTRGFGKKGDYQGKGYQLVFPDREHEHYWNLFKCTQQLWNEVNPDAKPRDLVYKINHQKAVHEA